MLCLVFAACASDEDDPCVTAFDCPEGYSCINSFCRPPVAETDTDSDETGEGDTGDVADTELPPSGGSDDEIPGGNEGDTTAEEIPDDESGCPNACSGFGTCDLETKKCTCDETHQGEDCSECKDGYHLEAEGDDEDGNPDIRSCVPNLTCNPNPCNNNGCKEENDTVVCTCSSASHLGGRWCDECEAGYLKSNVDGKCKPDCSGMTCTEPKVCGVDYTTNEASCNSPCGNDHYSGADCKSCDVDFFCNGHATACVVEGGTEKCTCATGYTGSKCENKSCTETQCFQSFSCTGTLTNFEYSVPGHCNPSTCQCDPGWLTASSSLGVGETVYCTDLLIGLPLDVRNNVLCTVCDVNNPPSTYATSGCPANCPVNFCNGTDSANGQGSCYTEPGTLKVYCKCTSGYTMTGSKYYEENSTGQCE